MADRPPWWINRFFFAALVAALASLLAVLISAASRHPDLGHRPIADMTINLGGRLVREHCTTCHPGGGRANPQKLGQVTKRHPDIAPHRSEQLGCTACHLGEGMALDTAISHGVPGYGARTVLTGQDLQATCYRCHAPAPLAGGEPAWKGYRLFFAKACNTCHAVSVGHESGLYGPGLAEIGKYLGLDQLQEAILKPRLDPPNSKMPRFPLSKKQARQISYFLKAQMGIPLYTTPVGMETAPVPPAEPDRERDRQNLPEDVALLREGQCLGCHKYAETDGRIGPDLTYIGRLRSADELHDFLRNPARLVPGSAMPRIPMDRAKADQLVRFLGEEAVGPVEAAGRKQFYMQLCQRCHAAGGDGRGMIQPNLAQFPRAFTGNAEFFRVVGDRRLLNSVNKGIPGTSMPGYGQLLDRAQVDDLLDLVFTAFIGISRHQKADLVDLPPEPDRALKGQAADALYRRHCVRCHGEFGTGTGTEALELFPRPRNFRNRPYVSSLPDERIARAIHDGIPGTAMPAFDDRLGGSALWDLVAKVRAFSRGDPR